MGIRERIDQNLSGRGKKIRKNIDDMLSGEIDSREYERQYTNELISTQAKSKVNVEDIAPVREDLPWYKKILQKPEAFDDGYQFGDVSKTILGTVGDIGTGVVKGVVGVGENIGTGLASGVAQIADWTGNDDYADRVRKKIATEEAPLGKWLDKGQDAIDTHSVIGDTGDQVTETVGQIASIWATGGLGGSGLATATMFGNAAGGTFKESYSKEGVTDAQVWTKAIGTGLIEAGTERLFGIFGKSGLDTGLANKISSKISSGAGKVLSRLGIQASGEAVEEFIAYAGNYLLDNGLVDKIGKAEYDSDWNWEEIGEQMGVAFLASGVIGAGGNVGSITNNMKANNMNFKDAINETARQQDVQGQLEDWKGEKEVLEQELTKKNLTQEDISEIFDEMQQADTQIKELEGQTAPIQAQVKEEVVQPNAQQITEEQAVQEELTLENIPEQATNERQTSDKQATTPTQQEIDNLLDIQKNKSGSEYAMAFYDLKKKYGDANLYKALNEENSKRKGITPQAQEIATNTEQESIVDNDNAFSNAPTSQNIVEQQNEEAFKNITDNDMPTAQENTTPAETDPVTANSPFENRDMKEAGNRSVKAYQYENPEVRPYFQQEAQNMLHDLDNTVKGQKGMTQDELGNTEFYGTTRQTAEAIAYLKDNYGYSYEQIRKGLNDIIEGKENNAVAKRIEFLLDERLRDGYITSDGIPIPANQDYINLLNEKQITEYNRETSKTLTDENIAPEQLKEEISDVIEEQVKDIKTELKALKKQIKEVQAPIKEATQNLFELTEEQNARIQELRDDTKKWTEIYRERYDDKKFAEKRIKGVAMQNAADIRKTIQGDLLIPIEGGLTSKELNTLTDKLKKNYIGKQVLVDGKEGTVTGNAYGKIGVEFADGTKQYVDKNSIQPLEDIDSIIQEQQRMYDQYQEQNIAPEPQETVAEPQTLRVEENIPVKETIAKKQNTELSDTSIETQEQEKIAQVLSETPTQANKKQRLWAKFRAGILDKGSVFEDLSIRNKNRELMSKWDYMLTAEARAQSVMINGHKQFDTETKTETQTSKSLNDIQTEVGDKVQEFSEYLYHKHNISRMSLEAKAQAKMQELQTTTLAEYDIEAIEKLSRKRITEKTSEETAELIETAKEYVRLSETKNKPVFGDSVTAEVSQEIVNEYEMENPQFMDWAKDVYDYNNANLDQLVQSGVISQETADQFAEMYPNYVPIGRANKNGNAINVPLDTNRTTINTPIKGAKGGNSDILPLFDTMAKRTIQTHRAVAKNNFGVELKNTLKGNTINQTTNVDEVLENVDQQESLLQEGKDGKAPTFTVFENGEKVTYEITQDIYEALKPVSDSSLLKTTIKPLNKISNFHRGVLTEYNPVFMLTNAIKDAQDILMNSQHPAKTYAKFGEAYAQIVKKGYWYQEYMSNGGEQNSYFDSQEGTFDTERKGISKVLDTFPLKTISQLNNVIEMAPRLAEYMASREAGRSIETSMLDAARVTTNFKAGGDITKWANRNGVTFLNASVQGAMQQVRNIREANANGLKGYANLALKFTIAGLPALLLNGLLWDDDEEYEELSDYVKQNYYIVGKYGDGNFIRIPKGRMVSVIQESFNQMKHLVTGDGEADLGQFLEIMGTNIAPNNPIANNVLSPIAQAVKNTTWYGDDLVPTRLQDEPVTEQFDESTDKLSIFLGQKLGISPYKINYVLDQYSGGIGDVFLPMMTQQAETGTDNVGSKLLAPLTNKFTVDSVMKNQNVSDLYSKSEELTSKANSTSATDEDILQNKYLNSIKSDMNELYKEKREIQSSNLSDSEKYEQVREIQEQINSMARNAMDNYENVKKTSNYATIGDKEYFLKNDTWTKVDKEEQAELNSLDMSLKDKSTYFNLKSQISDIKESDTEYKKSEIATLVRDSNLSDEQKAYIYGKNYSSDETLDMIVNSGISFNEYLNFASQEFVADKNSEGKSISGSRKNKIINYVNSLNLDIPQKAMLIRTEYKTFNDYNYDIVSYVDGLNVDYSEKVKILESLNMKVSADGTINW